MLAVDLIVLRLGEASVAAQVNLYRCCEGSKMKAFKVTAAAVLWLTRAQEERANLALYKNDHHSSSAKAHPRTINPL